MEVCMCWGTEISVHQALYEAPVPEMLTIWGWLQALGVGRDTWP